MILLVTYRSPILWILPLFSAGVALTSRRRSSTCSPATPTSPSTRRAPASSPCSSFGAGTDYALLLVARYREELRLHADRHEAMAEARAPRRPGRSSPAAARSILGMLCLLAADMNSTRGLGPVAAIGIVVTLAVMLTLLPALLVICRPLGVLAGAPDAGQRRAERDRASGPASAALISRGPGGLDRHDRACCWSACLGLFGLDAKGLTAAESFRGTPESVAGDEVAAQHFPAGAGNPVVRPDQRRTADEVRPRGGRHRRHRPGRATPLVVGDDGADPGGR